MKDIKDQIKLNIQKIREDQRQLFNAWQALSKDSQSNIRQIMFNGYTKIEHYEDNEIGYCGLMNRKDSIIRPKDEKGFESLVSVAEKYDSGNDLYKVLNSALSAVEMAVKKDVLDFLKSTSSPSVNGAIMEAPKWRVLEDVREKFPRIVYDIKSSAQKISGIYAEIKDNDMADYLNALLSDEDGPFIHKMAEQLRDYLLTTNAVLPYRKTNLVFLTENNQETRLEWINLITEDKSIRTVNSKGFNDYYNDKDGDFSKSVMGVMPDPYQVRRKAIDACREVSRKVSFDIKVEPKSYNVDGSLKEPAFTHRPAAYVVFCNGVVAGQFRNPDLAESVAILMNEYVQNPEDMEDPEEMRKWEKLLNNPLGVQECYMRSRISEFSESLKKIEESMYFIGNLKHTAIGDQARVLSQKVADLKKEIMDTLNGKKIEEPVLFAGTENTETDHIQLSSDSPEAFFKMD